MQLPQKQRFIDVMRFGDSGGWLDQYLHAKPHESQIEMIAGSGNVGKKHFYKARVIWRDVDNITHKLRLCLSAGVRARDASFGIHWIR